MNKLKKYRNLDNILIIFSFIIFSLLSISMLICSHYFMGFTDQSFHLKRILELKQSILNGVYLPMFSFNQFHGSAIMIFYPYMNLYPLAILSIFIKSKIILLYCWFIFNQFLTFLISYYSSYSFNKSKYISYLFSIMYGSSVLFLNTGSGFNDFGVTTSLCMLPIVIFGCFNFVKYNKYLQLSIGITLLVYSHILTTVIAIIFVFIWLLIKIKKFNYNKIIKFVKMIILTLLLTSIVWIPICEFMYDNKISLHIPPAVSSYNVFNVGLLSELIRSITNNIDTPLSIFAILSVMISVCFYKRLDKNLKELLLVSLIFIFICENRFPWKLLPKIILKFLDIFQTMSRFMIIPQILLCYILSIIIYESKFTHLVDIFVIILLASFCMIDSQHKIIKVWSPSPIITRNYIRNKFNKKKINYLEPYKLTNQFQFQYLLKSNYIPFFDYYPRASLNKCELINSYRSTTNEDNKIKIHHHGYNTFTFDNRKSFNYLILPIIGYNNNIKLYLDNHMAHYHFSKTRRIVINHIHPGKHRLKIQYMQNIYLLIITRILFLNGIIWIVVICIKRNKFLKL